MTWELADLEWDLTGRSCFGVIDARPGRPTWRRSRSCFAARRIGAVEGLLFFWLSEASDLNIERRTRAPVDELDAERVPRKDARARDRYEHLIERVRWHPAY